MINGINIAHFNQFLEVVNQRVVITTKVIFVNKAWTKLCAFLKDPLLIVNSDVFHVLEFFEAYFYR